MFDFPPDTPWIYAWLGAAVLIGLIIGWLLGRMGKDRLKRERSNLRSDLDEALESRRSSDEAVADAGVLAADLQHQVDETKTSLADADREITRLRAEVDAAETRAAQLETEARSSGQTDSQDLERLTSQLTEAQNEADALRAALSAATADTDARVSAAESEAQEATSRAAAIESTLSAAKVERDNLLQQLAEAPHAGTDESEGLISELRDQLAAARASSEAFETRLADAEDRAADTTGLLAEARAELEEARTAADDAGASQGEIAARDHLVRELQEKVTTLTDVDDRLKAREAELGELRRSQAGVLAAKDAEVRSLQDRLAAMDQRETGPDTEADAAEATQAALQAAEAELATVQERAAHWEQEAAALRAGIADIAPPAAQEPPPAAQEPPAAAPVTEAAPNAIEERLDRMQETLADKEARIAYLADRIARLESNLGSAPRPAPVTPVASPIPTAAPAPEPAPDPAPLPAPAEPDDLTALWGIGPAIQRKLNSVGITTYEQIAVLSPSDRTRLGDILGDFLDRFEADDWVGQARTLIQERGGTVPEMPLEPIRLTPPPAAVVPDDLTEIKGIGPFIQDTLNDLGINTFAQIAAWSDDDVEHFGEALVIFQGRIAREGWVDQARRLMRRR